MLLTGQLLAQVGTTPEFQGLHTKTNITVHSENVNGVSDKRNSYFWRYRRSREPPRSPGCVGGSARAKTVEDVYAWTRATMEVAPFDETKI